MKENDVVAQDVYNTLFRTIPKPPTAPSVAIFESAEVISLNWDTNVSAVAETERDHLNTGYMFEGYTVWQKPTPSSTLNDAVRIATFDKVNGLKRLDSPVYVPEFGGEVVHPVEFGDDTGIQRYFILKKDYINNVPFNKGQEYYFVVTAYNYHPDPKLISATSLRSADLTLTVVPQNTTPGVRYDAQAGDAMAPTHTTGGSDGLTEVIVVDPSSVTGHDYQIYFVEDTITGSPTNGEILWNVRDLTTSQVMVDSQLQISSLDAANDQPIVDGLQVKVAGPSAGFHGAFIVHDGTDAHEERSDIRGYSTFMYDIWAYAWVDDTYWPGVLMPPDDGRYWMTTANSHGDEAGLIADCFSGTRWSNAAGYDFEIRFVADSSWTLDWDFDPYKIPFEVWNVGIATPDDPSDDYQMITVMWDANGNAKFDWSGDLTDSGGLDDAHTDWIYAYNPVDMTPGTVGYDAMVAEIEGATGDEWDHQGGGVLRLLAFMNHNGVGAKPITTPLANMSDPDPANWTPADTTYLKSLGFFIDDVNTNGVVEIEGTDVAGIRFEIPQGAVYRLITNKPILLEDTYTFTAPSVTTDQSLAKVDVEKINVFPNPYYARNFDETNRFEPFVQFTHLPKKATIRIFNLAGTLVRKIEKDDDSQYLKWNLQNERGLLVASGMYIAHIDMPTLGKEKVLKLALVQSESLIRNF